MIGVLEISEVRYIHGKVDRFEVVGGSGIRDDGTSEIVHLQYMNIDRSILLGISTPRRYSYFHGIIARNGIRGHLKLQDCLHGVESFYVQIELPKCGSPVIRPHGHFKVEFFLSVAGIPDWDVDQQVLTGYGIDQGNLFDLECVYMPDGDIELQIDEDRAVGLNRGSGHGYPSHSMKGFVRRTDVDSDIRGRKGRKRYISGLCPDAPARQVLQESQLDGVFHVPLVLDVDPEGYFNPRIGGIVGKRRGERYAVLLSHYAGDVQELSPSAAENAYGELMDLTGQQSTRRSNGKRDIRGAPGYDGGMLGCGAFESFGQFGEIDVHVLRERAQIGHPDGVHSTGAGFDRGYPIR